jgi:hypothetical protein
MSRKPRICLATTMPGYDHACALDWVLAQALDLRGADVEMLICDKAIPVCQMTKAGRATPESIRDGVPMAFCDKCVARGQERLTPLGYPMRRLVDCITPQELSAARDLSLSLPLDQIATHQEQGLPVGDHARAGALRYFARGDLENEPLAEPVLRRYFEAGLRTIAGMRRLIETHKYDVLVVNHGIYIPQGMIVEVARAMDVRVVTYNPAYRKHCFTFSHDQSYHFTMLDEPMAHWRDFAWSERLADETNAYLASRRFGSNDWIWFHDKPREEIAPVLREIGCDPEKPFVAALTSVVWDAQLHYKANAFPNMMDWLKQTVEHWKARKDDLQLVIRVHPAEIRGAVPSRQKVTEELGAAFPEGLPPNVFIIPPDHQASTYALCENADTVIIFNTKAGVEMSALGVPVIVAGEAWIRGKGFAQDVSSPAQYFELLDALPANRTLDGEKHALAMRYAYHFFFRRMIPLPFMHQESNATFRLDVNDKSDLAPGRWPGLDTICDGILSGAPFVYRAEDLAEPFPAEAPAPQEGKAS